MHGLVQASLKTISPSSPPSTEPKYSAIHKSKKKILVIIDRLRSHKKNATVEFTEENRIELSILPQYPIESEAPSTPRVE